MAHVYQFNTIGHDGGGNAFASVQHFRLSEAGADTPYNYARKMCDAWQAQREADWLAALPQDCTLDYITGRRVTGGGGPTYSLARGTPGTWAADTFSAAMAVNIALIPGAGNAIGHIYFGPCPLDGVDKDALLGAYETVVQAVAAALLVDLTLTGGDGVATQTVFHRKTSTDDTVVNYAVRPKLTAMNRRLLPVI